MLSTRLEEKLIGSRMRFSMENRVYNAINLITIIFLVIFFFLNLYLGLFESLQLVSVLIVTQAILYYMARFKKLFKVSIIINALMSYAALFVNYFLNCGIDGPTIFLFFMTFTLLISITSKRIHILWFALHIIIPVSLGAIEYFHPGRVTNLYTTRFDRFFDIHVSYITTLVLIYFITQYLRRHHDEERDLAFEQAETIKQQKAVLENSEAKLRAFFNSSASCHMLLGKNGEVLDLNKPARTYLESTYNFHVETGSYLLDHITSSYSKRFAVNYRNALKGETISEEYLVTYSPTKAMWWAMGFAPVYNASGELLGVSFDALNIHERKTHEEKVKEQNQALSRIAFIQSHEIRRPVASIIGIMDIIKNEGYHAPKEYLQMLEQAAMELDEKIHKIIEQTKEGS